jgi:ADP-heptose:LPS heptosyltransferase
LQEKIKNILIINAGGGIGDALQFLKIFKLLDKEFNNPNINYYGNDSNNFWFETTLKSLKPLNVTTIKHYPLYYGFRLNHFFSKIIKAEQKYDLIIDNQSKIRNSLIYKQIPHKYFLTFAMRGLLSNPLIYLSKKTHTQTRVFMYLEKFLNKKINFQNYNIEINDIYENETKRLIDSTKKYIGFSIKAGHPTRSKEIQLVEIIKTAQYFVDKNYIPVFFIEEKNNKEITEIKNNLPKAYFPEHLAKTELKNPSLVIALANSMEFNVTIDNGVMHMLGLSSKKLFCFFYKNSKKFKPLRNNVFIYDCEDENTNIKLLTSKKIIEFIIDKI